MPYYPEVTAIKGLVRVVRERRLPPHAVPRTPQFVGGDAVEATSVVLQGDIMREFRVLDVADALRLRDPAQAAEFIRVEEGDRVTAGQELARRGRGRRARTLLSPVDGQVIRVEGSRLIVRASEQVLDVLATLPGEVESASDRTVQVVGIGALIQCAWGNGRFVFGGFRFLPEDGFVGLSKIDVHISEYRNVVVISTAPLSRADLLVAQQQEVAGVVAPSMSAHLRNFAMQLTFPVLLTEGFGDLRPSPMIYDLLQGNLGRHAAFNAAPPDHWMGERPEIMIPLPTGGTLPDTLAFDEPLRVGARVRLSRAPWSGLIGEVVELPETPQIVTSGLRLPSARVRLNNGRVVLVPLANLDLLG